MNLLFGRSLIYKLQVRWTHFDMCIIYVFSTSEFPQMMMLLLSSARVKRVLFKLHLLSPPSIPADLVVGVGGNGWSYACEKVYLYPDGP